MRVETSLLDTVRALVYGIGPRPSASEAEGRAAAYAADRLRAAGFAAEIEPFRGLRSFSLTYGILYAGFAASAALAAWFPAWAFALSLACLVLFALENGGHEVISRLLPGSPSRNVVGIRKPSGEAQRRVVLVCHLDSANAALLWHPKLVPGFRRSFVLMVAAMAAIVLLTGALALWPAPAPLTLRLPMWICGGYLLSTVLLLLHRQWCMPVVAGANDNASGIAAALAAVESCGDLRRTELWVVATGCEESGLIGMSRFCDTHPLDPEVTYFINLDNCGAGRVAFTTDEGMLWRARCDPGLVALAGRAAAMAPPLDAAPVRFHTMNNDSFVLLRRGFRALSIMAFDKRGLLPHWHWPTDTVENLEEETLGTAAALATRLVRLLDEGTEVRKEMR